MELAHLITRYTYLKSNRQKNADETLQFSVDDVFNCMHKLFIFSLACKSFLYANFCTLILSVLLVFAIKKLTINFLSKELEVKGLSEAKHLQMTEMQATPQKIER